jgi:hypothetical protein
MRRCLAATGVAGPRHLLHLRLLFLRILPLLVLHLIHLLADSRLHNRTHRIRLPTMISFPQLDLLLVHTTTHAAMNLDDTSRHII